MIKIYSIVSMAMTLLAAPILQADNTIQNTVPTTQDIEPGHCDCKVPEDYAPSHIWRTEPSEFLKGSCTYQARAEGGSEAFNSLLRIAQSIIRDNPLHGSIEIDNSRPINGDGYNRIVWWFEDTQKESNESSPIHAANVALCNYLNEHDHLFNAPQRTLINIKAYLYSFEKGYDREFGLEVASFFGHKNADPQKPDPSKENNDFTSSVENGIFNASTGIGNPLASILNLGIHSAINKKHAEELSILEWSCFVGESCKIGRTQNYYHPTNLSTKDEQLGIKLSATPRIFSDDESLVELSNINFFHASPSFDPDSDPKNANEPTKNSPILTFQLFDGGTLRLKTNELFVLGSYTMDRDVRTGKLVGTGDQKAHTKTLVLMSVSKQDQNTDVALFGGIALHKLDRSFTPEELEKLPDGKSSFSEIMLSLLPVCYPNPVNPYYREPICGFRFHSIDRKFVDYRLKFDIDGPLVDPNQRTTYWKLGEVYNGKGYYQLPLFEHDAPAQDYTLSIQIDDQGPSLFDRKLHDVVGIKFTFTHYKDSQDPIYFRPRGIQWIERTFWQKLFGG